MSDTETKAAHTPGPWEIDQWAQHTRRAGFPASIGQPEDADDPMSICTMDGDGDMATEWANARLIASAPELLDAAKYAMGVIAAAAPNDDSEEAGYFRKAWDKLCHAVARAEPDPDDSLPMP
jgi:hypothetical protein